MPGPFDFLFDLDRNGKMSPLEKGARAAFITEMFAEDEKKNKKNRDKYKNKKR